MTQTQIAERCGVTRSTVCRWESGTLRPNTAQAAQLAELFGVTDVDLTRVPQLLTVREAAGVLRVCTDTVRRWITGGQLPASRVGSHYRIAVADLAHVGTPEPRTSQ